MTRLAVAPTNIGGVSFIPAGVAGSSWKEVLLTVGIDIATTIITNFVQDYQRGKVQTQNNYGKGGNSAQQNSSGQRRRGKSSYRVRSVGNRYRRKNYYRSRSNYKRRRYYRAASKYR